MMTFHDDVMKEFVHSLKEDVTHVLGDTAAELKDECETTTCYSIAKLPFKEAFKIRGEFDGFGHYWLEVDDQIIDLSIEQFQCDFSFPVKDEYKSKYKVIEKIRVNECVVLDSVHIARICGFHV
jgi:hypothetical protein